MADDADIIPASPKCPICLQVPFDKLFECSKGHVICEGCYPRATICPQCHTPFDKNPINCLVVEGTNKLASLHLNSAVLQPPRRQRDICKFLNYSNCSFIVTGENGGAAAKHLESAHGWYINEFLDTFHFSFPQFGDFVKDFNSGKINASYWQIILSKFKTSYTLMWEIKYEAFDKAISFRTYFLRDVDYNLEKMPDVKFSISGSNIATDLKEFVFSLPVVDFLKPEFTWHRMLIPVVTLINDYEIFSTLYVSLDVS